MGAISGDINSLAMECEDELDLASRPTASLRSGDRAYVRTLGAAGRFFLDRQSTEPIDGVTVIAANGGAGRWLAEALFPGPVGAVGGDLAGSLPNPTVVGIHNIPVDLDPPANGDSILYDQALNQWVHAPITFGGGPPVGPAGGDLLGVYPNPTVVAIYTRPVANIAPTNGQALVWNGGAARWEPGTSITGPAGGDLSGLYPNPTVTAIQTRPVDPAAPSTGDLLAWDGTKWTPTSPSAVVGALKTVYGSFSSTQTQSIPNDGPTATIVTFDTVDDANGIQLSPGHPSRIEVLEDGVYEFSISPETHVSTGNSSVVTFWPRIDGTSDVPNSASTVEVGNNSRFSLPYVTYVLRMNAGQYVEFLFWAIGNLAELRAEPATAGPPTRPAQPSVIVVVKRISAIP